MKEMSECLVFLYLVFDRFFYRLVVYPYALNVHFFVYIKCK